MTAKYRAFISYSHADSLRGEWLHKALEAYRVPSSYVGMKNDAGERVEARLGTIFRDRDELTSGHDLAEAIRIALAASDNLIVICSPAAARSRYVNQEIIEFKRLGKADRVHAVIVAGEPHASAIQGAEDQECLPAALRFALDDAGHLTDRAGPEVLAPDLRPDKDEKNRALIKLIAGLLRIDFDVLYQRDRRRARRRTIALSSVTSALALTLALLGWTALERSREATRQQRLVAREAYATALGLAETSKRAGAHDSAVEQLTKQIPAAGGADLREFAWRYLWRPYDRHRHVVFVSGQTSWVEISPDGTRFAIANDSSLVTVWDVATGKEVARIEDRADRFRMALFVAGGTRIATESRDGNVRLWNLNDPRAPARELGKGLYPTLSPERKTLIFARGLFPALDQARLVDVEHGTETRIDPGETDFQFTAYSISRDERTVAFVDSRNVVIVIDARTGRKLRRRVFPADWRLDDVDFTPDGALLLRGAGRGTGVELRVWDPATDRDGPTLRAAGHPTGSVRSVATTANGDKVALLQGDSKVLSPAQESHVTVWERRTGRLLYDLGEEQTGFATAMQFSPTADVLATGSRDHHVKLWDASTGTLKGVVGIHHGTATRDGEEQRFHREAGAVFSISRTQGAGITALSFAAGGNSIVTGSGEFAAVRVWNAAVDPEGQELPTKGDSQTAVTFSPDGRSVITGDRAGVIATWDVAKRVKNAQVTGHHAAVLGLAVSPGGDRLAAASDDGVLRLWHLPQLIEEKTWTGAPGTTRALVLSKDGLTHLTRRAKGSGPEEQTGTYDLRFFTLDGEPKPGGTTVRADAIALSPDTHKLASFASSERDGSRTICGLAIWDVERAHSEMLSLGHERCPRFEISRIAWSLDGALLAVGGAAVSLGGSKPGDTIPGVRVFDARSGRERAMLVLPIGYSYADALNGLAFSPDGRALAALNVLADPENERWHAVPEKPAVTVWDVATSTRKAVLQVPQELCGRARGAECLAMGAFSRDGAVFSVVASMPAGGGSAVLFWRVGEKGLDKIALRDYVDRLLFSPAGDRAAALMRSRDFGEPAILWDRSPSRQVTALGSYVPQITALHQSHDGHLLAQTLEYPTTFGAVARVWDLESGRPIATATDSSASGHRVIDVSHDGRFIADLAVNGAVTIRRIGGPELPAFLAAESLEKGRPSAFTPQPLVLFSRDGARLATLGKAQTTVWDVATRRAIHTATGTVPAAFSDAADALATTDTDCKTITVSDASSGRQRARVVSPNGCAKALALSPDGMTLLSIRSDLQLVDYAADATSWDVRSGTVSASLRGYTDNGNSVAAFAPDGRTIATAGVGGTVNLWDPLTGRRLLTLAGPPVDVSSLSFSRDGDTLLVAHRTEVRFWRAAHGSGGRRTP